MSTLAEQITDLACDLAEEFALGMPEERFENVDGTPENALIKLTPSEMNELLVKAIQAGAAAELRRIGDEAIRLFPEKPPYALVISALGLLNRAAELDGGG